MALPYSARVISVFVETSMALSCPGKKQWRFLRKTWTLWRTKRRRLLRSWQILMLFTCFFPTWLCFVNAFRWRDLWERQRGGRFSLHDWSKPQLFTGVSTRASPKVGIVVYEDTEKYERIELQSSFLLRKAEENGSPAVKIGLKGETRLERLLYGVLVGTLLPFTWLRRKALILCPYILLLNWNLFEERMITWMGTLLWALSSLFLGYWGVPIAVITFLGVWPAGWKG